MEIKFPNITETYELFLALHDKALEDDAKRPRQHDMNDCIVAKLVKAHCDIDFVYCGTLGIYTGSIYRQALSFPEHLSWIPLAFDTGHIRDFAHAAALLRARYPESFANYESPMQRRERMTAEKLQEVEVR